jgi:hypothetical protein
MHKVGGNMWEKMLNKMLSGRFILTVICGVVFAWAVFQKQMESATITAILLSVFNSYFDRKDRGNPKGGV